MSKIFGLASALLGAIAVSTPALSADLGGAPWGRTAVAPEPYYSPIDTMRWTGFYVGGAYGYGTGGIDVARPFSHVTIDQDGGLGALYAGYNWQLGNIVLGLEGDGGTGSVDGRAGRGAGRVGSELNSLWSLRGRAGVLLSPAFLLYGTAGAAWGDFDLKANGIAESETFSGYQVGVGGELKISDPWALRLEYIYTDLGEETIRHGGVARSYEPDLHTVRAGITFKF